MKSLLKNSKIHYAWWILIVCTVSIMFSVGFMYYTWSILIEPLENAFGWSRSQISGVTILWVLVGYMIMMPAGKIVDKRGAKWVLIAGALASGIAAIIFILMNSIWHYYVGNIFFGIGGLTLGFMPTQAAITKWFNKKRGLAFGIAVSGGAVGAFISSRIMPYLLTTQYGYQACYALYFFIAIGLILPLAYFLMYRLPDDVGLKPYGETSETDPQLKTPQDYSNQGLTLRESFKTANLWIIVLQVAFANLAYNSILMHLVPILTGSGYSTERAAHILGYAVFVSAIGKFLGGYLSDKLKTPPFMAFNMIIFMIAAVSLYFTHSWWQLWIFIPFWGMALGFSAGVQAMMVTECFGSRYIGEIMAFGQIFQITGVAFGPLISGIIFDLTGSYNISIAIATILYLMIAIAILFVKPIYAKSKPGLRAVFVR